MDVLTGRLTEVYAFKIIKTAPLIKEQHGSEAQFEAVL